MSRPNPSKSSSHVPSSGTSASFTRPSRGISVLREPSARRDGVPSRGPLGPVATNTSRQDELSMVRAYPAPSDRAPSLARASRNLDVYQRANFLTGTVNASGTGDDKPAPAVDGVQGSAIGDHPGAHQTGLVDDASDPEPPTENNTPSSFATTLSDHEDDDSRVASAPEARTSNTGFRVEQGQASRSALLGLDPPPTRRQDSLRTIRGDEDATAHDSPDTVCPDDDSWDEGVARIYPDRDAADEEDEDTSDILAGLNALPTSESSSGDLSWDEGVARIEYDGDVEDEDEEYGGIDNILVGLDGPSTGGNRKTSRR